MEDLNINTYSNTKSLSKFDSECIDELRNILEDEIRWSGSECRSMDWKAVFSEVDERLRYPMGIVSREESSLRKQLHDLQNMVVGMKKDIKQIKEFVSNVINKAKKNV